MTQWDVDYVLYLPQEALPSLPENSCTELQLSTSPGGTIWFFKVDLTHFSSHPSHHPPITHHQTLQTGNILIDYVSSL